MVNKNYTLYILKKTLIILQQIDILLKEIMFSGQI
jgi:hypothetical protein